MIKKKPHPHSYLTAIVVIAATTAPAMATDKFYAGADAVFLATEFGDRTLGLGTGASFGTTHLRMRAGYHLLDFLAVEAYLMTPDDDSSESSTTSSGSTTTVTDKIETDPLIGINLKFVKQLESMDIYGLIGISRFSFDFVYAPLPLFSSTPAPTTTYSDSVTMYGAGAGIAFNLTEKIKLNFEGMYQTGTTSFDVGGSTSSNSSDVDSFGISAGASYYF
jgi:opacity protein-like surface antigen